MVIFIIFARSFLVLEPFNWETGFALNSSVKFDLYIKSHLWSFTFDFSEYYENINSIKYWFNILRIIITKIKIVHSISILFTSLATEQYIRKCGNISITQKTSFASCVSASKHYNSINIQLLLFLFITWLWLIWFVLYCILL